MDVNTFLMTNAVHQMNWGDGSAPAPVWIGILLVVISLIILLVRYIRNDLKKGTYD